MYHRMLRHFAVCSAWVSSPWRDAQLLGEAHVNNKFVFVSPNDRGGCKGFLHAWDPKTQLKPSVRGWGLVDSVGGGFLQGGGGVWMQAHIVPLSGEGHPISVQGPGYLVWKVDGDENGPCWWAGHLLNTLA